MYNPKEERTFVLVKPDGVRKGLIGEILKRFEQRDLKIVALEMFQPTFETIDNHYPKSTEWITRLGNKTLKTYEQYGVDPSQEHPDIDPFVIGQTLRSWLVDYMVSAPMVKMVVQGVHAIDMVRKIVGPTLPYMAEMGTIRGDFSTDSPILANKEGRAIMNLVHASENKEEAEHEIKHWFSDQVPFSYRRFGVDE